MGAAVSFIGAGGPAPPPTVARRGVSYLEGVEVSHEMYVLVSTQVVQPDNSESAPSPALLNHLIFAKVRTTPGGMPHPLDPPVLVLIPQQATPDGLMPLTEKVAIFTSRTLRSVVYYRGELALELMPKPAHGPARKRFTLRIADEHVSKKAWKAHTRVMTMQFRAYWEQLEACGIPRAKPGFVAPVPVVLEDLGGEAGEGEGEAGGEGVAASTAGDDLMDEAAGGGEGAPEPLPAPTVGEVASETAASAGAAGEDTGAGTGLATQQLLVGGKTNYPKALRPTPPRDALAAAPPLPPPGTEDRRRSRGTAHGDDASSQYSGRGMLRAPRGGPSGAPGGMMGGGGYGMGGDGHPPPPPAPRGAPHPPPPTQNPRPPRRGGRPPPPAWGRGRAEPAPAARGGRGAAHPPGRRAHTPAPSRGGPVGGFGGRPGGGGMPGAGSGFGGRKAGRTGAPPGLPGVPGGGGPGSLRAAAAAAAAAGDAARSAAGMYMYGNQVAAAAAAAAAGGYEVVKTGMEGMSGGMYSEVVKMPDGNSYPVYNLVDEAGRPYATMGSHDAAAAAAGYRAAGRPVLMAGPGASGGYMPAPGGMQMVPTVMVPMIYSLPPGMAPPAASGGGEVMKMAAPDAGGPAPDASAPAVPSL